MPAAVFKPKLWTPGDWNAFFGFGTNILVNLLVLTGAAALRLQDARTPWCLGAFFRRSAS